MFAFDYGLIYWGEQFLASGLAAILFATMPLFVAFFAAILIPHERMTPTQIAGTILGFLGVVVIFLPDLRLGGNALLPSLAIVASAAAAGVTSVVVRRFAYDLKPIALNACAMLIGGVALLAASAFLGESLTFPETARAWTSLLYLVVLGSILSFFLYWNLLREWPAQRAGLIPIATPVVALITGFLLNSEVLSLLQVLGSTIVILGVALSLLPMPVPKPVLLAAAK
jgi:drug/metabolite transporter (DMT)-like permease